MADFIEFLKRSVQNSSERHTNKKSYLSEEDKKFYRTAEEGKLAKVIDIFMENEKNKTEKLDKDDLDVSEWKKNQSKKFNNIIKTKTKKNKSQKRHDKGLLNLLSHSFFHPIRNDQMLNNSQTMRFATVALGCLIIAVFATLTIPEKINLITKNTDKIFLFPFNMTNPKQVNKLPATNIKLTNQQKSEFIKNNQNIIQNKKDQGINAISVNQEIFNKNIVRKNSNNNIVVLGVDSEEENKTGVVSDLISDIKAILKKIGKKQEEISVDMNYKLLEKVRGE